jgi:hypothetical protein
VLPVCVLPPVVISVTLIPVDCEELEDEPPKLGNADDVEDCELEPGLYIFGLIDVYFPLRYFKYCFL